MFTATECTSWMTCTASNLASAILSVVTGYCSGCVHGRPKYILSSSLNISMDDTLSGLDHHSKELSDEYLGLRRSTLVGYKHCSHWILSRLTRCFAYHCTGVGRSESGTWANEHGCVLRHVRLRASKVLRNEECGKE